MPPNPSHLSLLADHIKLSLLERQRAKALQLDSRTQDAEIRSSLESMQKGLIALTGEQDSHFLQKQYNELYAQFHGSAAISNKPVKPNNEELANDFSSVQTARLGDAAAASSTTKKSVRFSDTDNDANRAALLPYRDDPEIDADHGQLNNEQIHEYHSEIMRRQDEELGSLGASIGRQREIGIRIRDELDEQVEILDDVDRYVDRHQSQLDRARNRLEGVARRARDNIGLTAIVVLILVLILLLVIL